MTKEEILEALEASREAFLEAIEGLSGEAMQEKGVVEGWSIKDILIHLSLWEAELVRLLWQARQNERPTTLHFSKQDVDSLNAAWTKKNLGRPLERALEDFHAVRNQTMHRVEAFSDQDLNDPKRYAWLDNRPLWEWIAGDSFEHEAEHAVQIRAWREAHNLTQGGH